MAIKPPSVPQVAENALKKHPPGETGIGLEGPTSKVQLGAKKEAVHNVKVDPKDAAGIIEKGIKTAAKTMHKEQSKEQRQAAADQGDAEGKDAIEAARARSAAATAEIKNLSNQLFE